MFNPRRTFPLPFAVLALAAAGFQPALRAQTTTALPFSKIVVFGDSLSDVGNDADVIDNGYGIRFPGPAGDTFGSQYDYTDGRFTDGTDTNPPAVLYTGVWHEQLASLFLGLPPATASLDGGMDFAYGDATTDMGLTTISEAGGAVSVQVENMGRQVANYLDAGPADGGALIIVWGGANDLLNDDSGDNVTAAAMRETALVQRLAENGGKFFLVPNLPPIDQTPAHQGDTELRQACIDFNTQLAANLAQLQSTTLANEGISISLYQLDVHGLFERLLSNQYAYGITNVTDPAQGADDPDHHISWDGLHPTTAGHYQLAAEAYTVLTGVPVVEINPKPDNTGFYVTRTGPDVSAKLSVHYKTGGTAVSGKDYASLPGVKKLRAGKQTAEVDVTPTAGDHGGRKIKVKLIPEETYVRPVEVKAVIKLD